MVRAPSKEPVASLHRKTHAWTVAAAIIGAVAMVATVIPAYWGYACRYHGRLCEGSPLVPTSENAVRRNVDFLKKQLARTDKPEIVGLDTSIHSGWLEDRVDIIARTSDGTDLVVDKIDLTGERLDEIDRDTSGNSLLIFASRQENKTSEVSLRLYAVNHDFQRKSYSLTCRFSDPSTKPSVKIKNAVWDPSDRKLAFEVQSNCLYVNINDNKSLVMRKYDPQSQIHEDFGKMFEVTLDKNYFIESIIDQDTIAERKALDKCYTQQLKDFKEKHPALDNGIGVCYSVSSNGTHLVYSGNVISLSKKDHKEIDDIYCGGDLDDYTETDKYSIVQCKARDNNNKDNKVNNASSVSLTLYRLGKKAVSTEIKCECSDLSVKNSALDNDGTLITTLIANKELVTIGYKTFKLGQSAGASFSGIARVSFDDRGNVSKVVNAAPPDEPGADVQLRQEMAGKPMQDPR
jgi:hypothetical protein